MSVATNVNPIVVVASDAGSTVIDSGRLQVRHFNFVSGASGAAGDIVTIKDKNGMVRYEMTIDAAKQTKASPWFNPPLFMDGLIVSALSHGTLYIHLDRK